MISKDVSPEELCDRFNVSRESLSALKTYAASLLRWQKKINLIGPSTAPQLWHRHIGDGLQLLPIMGQQDEELQVLDLGSGGGVPGAILALCRPKWTVGLVESNRKKVAFLREVARVTGATNISFHDCRIEELPAELNPDWVTSRALARLPRLLELASPLLTNARALFHKGQDVDAELTEATKCWNIKSRLHPSLVEEKSWLLEIVELKGRNDQPK